MSQSLQGIAAAIHFAVRSAPSYRNLAPEHRSATARVYFIQAGENGPVKIGRARDPEARRRALQVSNHECLTLLAVSPGLEEPQAEAAERPLHVELIAFHVRGEWFRDCVELREALALCGEAAVWALVDGLVAA